jgi:hypothetical protein
MAPHTLFIKQLAREKATLNENAHLLSENQGKSFQLCCELLREKATSLAKRSRSRRSVRLRARSLLVDVFTGLGPEVFLLCTLAASISNLATIPKKGLVPELRRWWKTVSHPKGLTEIANQACQANSISGLIVPTAKRRLCGTADITGPEDSLRLKNQVLISNRGRIIAKQTHPFIGESLVRFCATSS